MRTKWPFITSAAAWLSCVFEKAVEAARAGKTLVCVTLGGGGEQLLAIALGNGGYLDPGSIVHPSYAGSRTKGHRRHAEVSMLMASGRCVFKVQLYMDGAPYKVNGEPVFFILGVYEHPNATPSIGMSEASARAAGSFLRNCVDYEVDDRLLRLNVVSSYIKKLGAAMEAFNKPTHNERAGAARKSAIERHIYVDFGVVE